MSASFRNHPQLSATSKKTVSNQEIQSGTDITVDNRQKQSGTDKNSQQQKKTTVGNQQNL